MPEDKALLGDSPLWSLVSTSHGFQWLLLLLFAVGGYYLIQGQVDRSTSNTTSLISALAHYEDESNSLSSVDVIQRRADFIPSDTTTYNFGLNPSDFWIWLTVDKPATDPTDLMLEVSYTHLDHLDVYQVESGKATLQYNMGDFLPFNDRPVSNRGFVIPLTFSDDSLSRELLLHVRSEGPVAVPLTISTVEQYHKSDREEQLILGFYYGILFGILAYNLLIAIGTREAVYGYYCIYAASQMLYQMAQNGLAFEFLWPDLVAWQQVAPLLLTALAMFFCTLFTHHFLNIDNKATPRLYISFRMMESCLLLLVLAVILVERPLAIQLLSVIAGGAAIFLFVTAFIAYLQGNPNAHYYLLSFSILLLGVLVFVAKTLGYLPDLFVTEYATQMGSAIEMILLSYALADRFNRLRMENIRVHENAKATLEQNVVARTRQLSTTLQQLELANTKLERLNNLDPMTSIYNRRYFNEILERIHREMVDQGKPLSLMMIDIDHFKRINDNQGHLKGDEVILRVAKIIGEHCRENRCVPARFGGEEFVVLMPDHQMAPTLNVAESIRQRVEETAFLAEPAELEHSGYRHPVARPTSSTFSATVSIGITTVLPDKARTMTGLELVDQADQALYSAKQNGRNCCYYYEIDDSGQGVAHAA